MNRTRFALTLATATSLFSIASARPQYIPDEVLVKFRPGTSNTSNLVNSLVPGTVVSEIPQLGVQRIKLRPGASVQSTLRYLRGQRNVVYAEQNVVDRAAFVPNDPMYNQQYGLPRISAVTAWDLTIGSSNVKVGVVDTGIDYNHPDLSGKVTLGRDFVNNDNDPMDDQGHGTHCAGIVAAKTNNGVGVAGIGFNSSLIAVKVLNADGVGQADWTAAGIVDAADRGAQIISVSIGGGDAQVKRDAVKYAWDKGAVVVAAAGNENTTDRSYPGADDFAIGVGASDQNDQRASFSNYGADWVDVAAPGVAILSTVPGNGYEEFDGTSMACPMVSGLLALMKAYAPEATNVELRTNLEANCDNIGNWISKGRVNAFKAVNGMIRPIEKEFNVKDVTVYSGQGSGMSGVPSSLVQADASRVTLRSVPFSGGAAVAAIQSGIPFVQEPAKVRSTSFLIQGQTLRGVTVQLYLYNFGTRQYEIVKAFTASGGYDRVEVPVLNMSKYTNGTEIRAITRGFLANQRGVRAPTYNMTLDVLKLMARVNP